MHSPWVVILSLAGRGLLESAQGASWRYCRPCQPGAPGQWNRIDSAYLDHRRPAQKVSDAVTAMRREAVYRLLESCEMVQPTPAVYL
ncbi:MAG: hypothetical protein JJE04_09320 [Acidobacteriia bacterium]|nr:hypothetical protein [Terriglobia bacterium]